MRPAPKLCADIPPRGSITLDARDVHRLSNHLAVIIGFVELLIADAPPGHPHFADLVEIRTAALAAANLIGKTTPPGTATSPGAPTNGDS
jgi:hypothetical protein